MVDGAEGAAGAGDGGVVLEGAVWRRENMYSTVEENLKMIPSVVSRAEGRKGCAMSWSVPAEDPDVITVLIGRQDNLRLHRKIRTKDMALQGPGRRG